MREADVGAGAMDLSAPAAKGLSLLGDKAQMPDAAFKATVIAVCHSLTHPEAETGLLGELPSPPRQKNRPHTARRA